MPILIDGHVHIYPGFSVNRFLDAAGENFIREGRKAGLLSNADCVLALTEGKGCDIFSQLKEKAVSPENDLGGFEDASFFRYYRTEESESLIACKGEVRLLLIAGRQIVSRENIELLSLFCSVKMEDRTLALVELAQYIADEGGLPVLPWSAGKWWGARGRVVSDLLHSNRDYTLFLGDNGNRPKFWPKPDLLRQACEMQLPILSGSDPLPFNSHVIRPGSFGALLHDGELPRTRPAAYLRKILAGKNEIVSFGDRSGALQFTVDQLRINLQNRMKSG